MGEDRDRAIGEAFERHRAQVAAVLPSGDRAAIKQLYVSLGSLLEEAAAGDAEAVPLLSFPEIGPAVASLLDEIDGRVLDAGCGPYPLLSLLIAASSSRHVVAMDISEGIVRLARARAAGTDASISYVVGDVEALPFRDGAFDGIACEDTIEHVPDDAAALAELARVLRSRGRLVLTSPNRVRIGVLALRARDLIVGRRKEPSAYFAATSHLREYTWTSLEGLAGRCLRLVRRGVVPWTGGALARLGSALVARPPLRAVSRMVVLVLEPRRP